MQVEATARLAESAAGDSARDYLQMMLERALSERVRRVLRFSQSRDADFLGLAGRLSRGEPRLTAEAFAARWPSLPLTVSVHATLEGGGPEDAP